MTNCKFTLSKGVRKVSHLTDTFTFCRLTNLLGPLNLSLRNISMETKELIATFKYVMQCLKY